jgi:vesicle-fusing ATPase
VIFTNDPDNSYSWLQYGGPERNYEALDIGFCLLLEIILLPSGLILPLLSDVNGIEEAVHEQSQDMIASNLRWRPEVFLSRKQPNEASIENAKKFKEVSSTNGNFNACSLETNFCASIGGLQPKIHEIIRRVLDGRVIQPVSDESNAGVGSISCELDRIRRQEMEGLLELGLRPVKGVLLYGPPGCGKTHLSRQISKILDARPPKIIAAPELLDRWVGGTEQMVRELFADAEYELQSCGGDPTKSALHVIVIDEIDAVFRKRSALDSSSEVTRASAVNQILAKLDGMQSLENILFIGMTNRRELLDKALLRPGRLECQIEIPLPDQNARREILKIHFGPLRERGRLSRPLCNAIDGIGVKSSKMDEIKRLYQRFKTRRKMSSNISDLASDYCTHSFSGADLAGLVRNAGSIALARARMQGEGSLESLQITLTDVDQALREIKQQKYFQ